MWPFEVMEGMEEKHTLETDLTRCPQDLEEGDRFESSDLRLERCCFLALLRVDTHLLRALWKELRLPSVGFALILEHEAMTIFVAGSGFEPRLDSLEGMCVLLGHPVSLRVWF